MLDFFLAAAFFFGADFALDLAAAFLRAGFFAAASAADDASAADAFGAALRPQRPLRSGAAARIAWHSSSESDLGSRSFGILPFFLPSVMYGP